MPPWPGSDDLDFHGTLAAVWIWTRAEKLTGQDRFALNIAAGWSFVEKTWSHFIPTAIGPTASDEAPMTAPWCCARRWSTGGRAAPAIWGR